MSEIIFDEPKWSFDFDTALITGLTNSASVVERYLIKMKFIVDGRKGYSIAVMNESPEDNPELYSQIVQKMKDGVLRGDIQEPPGIIEV